MPKLDRNSAQFNQQADFAGGRNACCINALLAILTHRSTATVAEMMHGVSQWISCISLALIFVLVGQSFRAASPCARPFDWPGLAKSFFIQPYTS